MQKWMKWMWFSCGLFAGLVILSVSKADIIPMDRLKSPVSSQHAVNADASDKSTVIEDAALYQQLSEIHARRELKKDFDFDIYHLSQVENRYREKLPFYAEILRLKTPMQRIAKQKYHFSGSGK